MGIKFPNPGSNNIFIFYCESPALVFQKSVTSKCISIPFLLISTKLFSSILFTFCKSLLHEKSWHQYHRLHMARLLQIDVRFSRSFAGIYQSVFLPRNTPIFTLGMDKIADGLMADGDGSVGDLICLYKRDGHFAFASAYLSLPHQFGMSSFNVTVFRCSKSSIISIFSFSSFQSDKYMSFPIRTILWFFLKALFYSSWKA